MASNATFADLDDKAIYDQSLVDVLSESTLNFVVDFGQQDAKIAFNVGAEEGERLLTAGLSKKRPVRWMYVFPTVLSRHEACSNLHFQIEMYGLQIVRRTSLMC
jgi:hypothetical protein